MFERLVDWSNLLAAHRAASKGKRGRPDVAAFECRLEDNLFRLRETLIDGRYRPSAYRSFIIHEPKRRLISAAPFHDRVVHHALCQVTQPSLERSFVADSYANRVGKGNHRSIIAASRFARRYAYVLQLDIQQFFPSIDHAILRGLLVKKITQQRVMALVDLILSSGVGVLGEVYQMRYFPGDDLFAALRPRGLPIGNLTSQLWANVYLNPLDHFIKRELRCPAFVRYVDDLLLFGDEKQQMWQWKQAIIERLETLRLTQHPGVHPRPTSEGFPFLGFMIFPTLRRLKRRKGVYYQRNLKQLLRDYEAGDVEQSAVVASILSWNNHVSQGNTLGLRRAIFSALPADLRYVCREQMMKRIG